MQTLGRKEANKIRVTEEKEKLPKNHMQFNIQGKESTGVKVC